MSSQFELPVSATGNFLGATVSNLLYHTLATSGDIVAQTTESSIEFTGNMIGLGTDMIVGPIAGNAVRALARTYGAVAKPAISTTSKLGAAGISFLAGTGTAITTTALVYGGRKISSYVYGHYMKYKLHVASNIQYPVPHMESKKEIICIDDPEDLSLLEQD
jgi:hypothetical protein